ncbi:MAG: murein biosynthesis integral membrane protein MurJ [Thermodesulfobacteriota bacterium]
MTDNGLFKKIGIATFIMMASIFASRVIGLFREMAIAFAGGAQGCVDAYQVAFILPEILNHIVASGFLSVTFIPIFTSYLTSGKEEEGWKVFSIIFNTFGLLLLVFIITTFAYAPELVSILAPGLKDPELFQSAVRMTRIIIPAQFFFFTGGLFMAVQFAREKFLIPALAPLLYNLGIIAGGLLLSPLIGMEGFAWGVLAGAFTGNFLLQYAGAKRLDLKLYPLINIKHPDFIRYILLTLPLMVGLTMTFSTEILLKFFGSYLDEGSIASLNYSLRIMFILVGFFGQAVGVASYPFMAQLAEKKEFGRLNEVLNSTLKFLILVIPFSVLMIVLRYETVLLLFQRGEFGEKATIMTSNVLPFLLAGAFAFAAQTVVVRGYYAAKNTWFPALFGTVTVVCSLPLFFLFMNLFQARGVAIALSVSAFLQVMVLYELWSRRTGNRGKTGVYLFFLKISLISILIGLILSGITSFLYRFADHTTLTGALRVCAVATPAFFILFIGAGYTFRIHEIFALTRAVRQKLRRP